MQEGGGRGSLFMSMCIYLRLSSEAVVKALGPAKHFNAINLNKSFLRSVSLYFSRSSPSLLSVSLAGLAKASLLCDLSLSLSGPLNGGQYCSSPWILYYFYELSSCPGTNIYPCADRAMHIRGWSVNLIYLPFFFFTVLVDLKEKGRSAGILIIFDMGLKWLNCIILHGL